ncbi:MAG: hypothetical protein A2Y40_07245 [Candidatus Margulisbacteria bacterium GWF2_35_9]|nr:MAG: hypothetical protein A2Y40_07245 [Candidatus Margulisbacteria bacterium GWF2_35_9]
MTTVICIICPNSCECVVNDNTVSGAKCKRGVSFSLQEVSLPLRTVTSTICCQLIDKRLRIPVKTKSSVPIKDIPHIMKRIKQLVIYHKPELGELIINKDILMDTILIITGT